MLKTQLLKAVYLGLFCFLASSFVAGPNTTATISSPDEAISTETPFVTDIRTTKVFRAPSVKLNKQALLFANRYIRTDADDLAAIKQRSKRPFIIMDSVFRSFGLPVELKYLAVIESDLKPSALSHVGAAGPWQLMPEIAHDMGLKITRQYDERTNYYKSTRAAAKYLKYLYSQFGDWLLVLAAYNSGPRPVYAAIRRSGSRNFWALQSFLPAETRGHVKRFIATHYYFEGQGSVTTLTKSEHIEYTRSINEFAVAHSAIGLPGEQAADYSMIAVTDDQTGITGFPYMTPAENAVIIKRPGSHRKSFRKTNKVTGKLTRHPSNTLSA